MEPILLKHDDLQDWIFIGIYFVTTFSCFFTIFTYLKKKKERKVVDIAFLRIVSIILIFISLMGFLSNTTRHYNIDHYEKGISYEEEEDWENAYHEFALISYGSHNFRDAKNHLDYVYPRFMYDRGYDLMDLGEYKEANDCFRRAGDYLNAEFFADYCYFLYLKEEHPIWFIEKE